MNYPMWDVPIIGSGWVIGAIAIFHVLVSHFAVGGGFYLPMAEAKAAREGRDDWMRVVKSHAKFFLILTAVFGAVTGVGIWFAIGLASPEGTSTLIHYFVFGWAIEWVFFIVEITAAAVYYYTWGRIPLKLHLIIGWIYAGAAWMSLFIINGILTFMLTPSSAWLELVGTGTEANAFIQAFFNPTYWPSLVLRTLVTIALAGVWAMVTASRINGFKEPELKESFIRWSVKWLVPAFVLMPFAFAWYLYMVPESQRELLQLGISTIGQGTFTQVTRAGLVIIMTSATILPIIYFFGWRNPRDFTMGHAISVLILALAATASTEQAREMIRKPYVIREHMFSNGVRKSQVAKFNEEGYLKNSPWASQAEKLAWKAEDEATTDDTEVVQASTDAAATPSEAQLLRGELMMRGQCMSCHTVDGYRSLRRLMAGRDRESIGNILTMLHEYKEDSPYRSYMPPLVGQPEEVEALGDYLNHLINNAPKPRPVKELAEAEH
ncbi:cytochrome ubiquinol oxidase subunit I [bacterium]|nr:cytochrome ubiquinol oxidase subunit I [bacterium]